MPTNAVHGACGQSPVRDLRRAFELEERTLNPLQSTVFEVVKVRREPLICTVPQQA
jgi:hypothetical protein